MAVAANALTTLATAKTELGSPSGVDSVIERLVNVASDAIERYCGRTLYRTASIAEKVRGHGGQILLVSRTPIASIASIEELPSSLTAGGDGTTLESTSYAIRNANAGSIFRLAGWGWSARYDASPATRAPVPGTEDLTYLVTYAGGYVTPEQGGTRTLPYDIEQACIDSVVHLFRTRGRYRDLQAEKDEAADDIWAGSVIPKPALRLLEKYRRIR